jgi:glycosyltransferase involved in cell wall biosynthesis
MKIDISVIIPMYNAEKYIEGAINSVLQQKDHHFEYEIIVVDDKSIDNSIEIVKKINYPKVILIELKTNSGVSHARNVGMKAAKGEWIQFLDSDDRVGNGLYQKFELSMKSDVNCYLFSIQHIFNSYILEQIISKIHDKRAFGYFGSVWNKFFKRDICLPFIENYIFEDTIFLIDILIKKDLKLALISDAFYLYNRTNCNSITYVIDDKAYYKMFENIMQKLNKCDKLTKMFILETFLAIALRRDINIFIRMRIVSTILAKLYRYLPAVLMDQNRTKVKNMMY